MIDAFGSLHKRYPHLEGGRELATMRIKVGRGEGGVYL